MNFQIGAEYTRETLGELLNDSVLKKTREGIVKSNNTFLLFVTLDKTKQANKKLHYNDFFEGALFHWDSQTTQSINTPRIQQIAKGEIEVFLFARIHEKTKSKTNPFICCGSLSYKSHNEKTSKPVHIIFNSLDYEEEPNSILAKIYDWNPTSNQPRTAYYEDVLPKSKTPKKNSAGGQGYARDQAAKVATELLAMKTAINFYEGLGYEVVDTSSNESFDLLCAKAGEVLKVEVKGTTSLGKQVLVTANEVKEARMSGVKTDLFILHSIKVVDSNATGGTINRIECWNPSDDSLVPTMFKHSIA